MAEFDLLEWSLDEERYTALLEKLINESRHLQNAPGVGLVPQEHLVARHVFDVLDGYTKELAGDKGRLSIRVVEYVKGRPNVVLEYRSEACNTASRSASQPSCISFVGSHMDVVPADPANWERDPFTYHREGDILYGRGECSCNSIQFGSI